MKAIKAERSLADQVYDSIRDSILSGRLVPGTLHSVKSLADELEVSRTPVREALIDLASQGMVRFERNRGVRILQRTAHDILEIFSLRLLMEVPATRAAVPRLTDGAVRMLEKEFDRMGAAADAGDEPRMMRHDRRFHVVLLEASGNERLARATDQLRDQILTQGVSTVGRSRSLPEVVEPHRRILEAARRRDAHAAAAAMRDHVLSTGRLILTQEGGDPSALEEWASFVTYPRKG
ncbi:MAG: GntR family transcriptional regulator [Acidimicrobiia bacterium]|nr:GntR family transcriptional regulator [Acidimicrobiia bacterium]